MALERRFGLFLSSTRVNQPFMREYIIENAYILDQPERRIRGLIFTPLIAAGAISLAVMIDRFPGALNDIQRGINYLGNQIFIK